LYTRKVEIDCTKSFLSPRRHCPGTKVTTLELNSRVPPSHQSGKKIVSSNPMLEPENDPKGKVDQLLRLTGS
jgi:hypothetical protein